jgi:hypothetical protein
MRVLSFLPIVAMPAVDWLLFELSRAQEDPEGRLGLLLSTSEIRFVWNLIGLITVCWIGYVVWLMRKFLLRRQ